MYPYKNAITSRKYYLRTFRKSFIIKRNFELILQRSKQLVMQNKENLIQGGGRFENILKELLIFVVTS